jgi:cell volume regulation protein A
MEPWNTAVVLSALGVLLVLAALCSPLSERLGIPALVLFLVIGILAGSEGLGGIWFDDQALAFRIGIVALAMILFDGGLNTSMETFRRAARPALVLATAGVVLTAGAVALFALWLGLTLPVALLVGSVVSSTDAAAVFSVLRGMGVQLKSTTSALLEVESGLNDPMAVLLTLVAVEVALGAENLGWETLGLLVQQIVVGAAGGVAVGFAGRFFLRLVRLPVAGLYPVLTIGIALAAFGLPTLLNGSGFLAVYIAGLLLASGPLPYRAGVKRVHDAMAWLAQIVMFLMLGLLVFPAKLLPTAGVGLALALFLAFVARPLAVLICLAPFRFNWPERLFISWAGLRGAVPIILATFPGLSGVAGGDQLFHLVFFAVLVNSFVPGATISFVARRLGLTTGQRGHVPASIELISLRDYKGEFVWYTVQKASAVASAAVRDLPLPDGCTLSLVLHGEQVLAPRGATVLHPGDHVCIFITPGQRGLLDLLFGSADE